MKTLNKKLIKFNTPTKNLKPDFDRVQNDDDY